MATRYYDNNAVRYVKRDGYIGTYQYTDVCGWHVYRFPGGDSVVFEDEVERTGSNELIIVHEDEEA